MFIIRFFKERKRLREETLRDLNRAADIWEQTVERLERREAEILAAQKAAQAKQTKTLKGQGND